MGKCGWVGGWVGDSSSVGGWVTHRVGQMALLQQAPKQTESIIISKTRAVTIKNATTTQCLQEIKQNTSVNIGGPEEKGDGEYLMRNLNILITYTIFRMYGRGWDFRCHEM